MATGKTNRLLFERGAIPVDRIVGRGFESNLTPMTYGNVWYVDSTHSAASSTQNAPGWGGDADHPFATIAYAVTQSKILTGDVIIVNEGHVESVSAADAWLWANAGIYVVGMGWQDTRPVITFDTATTATVLLDKAGCILDNLSFVCGIADLATMFSVTAGGCSILNSEFIQTTSAVEALNCVSLGSGGDRFSIYGCDVDAADAGNGDAFLTFAAVVDRMRMGHCHVFGNYDLACVQSAVIHTACLIHDNILTNTLTGQHSLQFSTTATGNLVRNMYANDLTQATGADTGACKSFENYHCDAVDVSGILSPVAT